MSSIRTRPKHERLEARITPEQKALFQHAAALEGRSLTDFIVRSLQTAAQETIERHEIIRLSPSESLAFVETILNPPPPNEHLLAAARLHRELIAED